MNKTNKGFIIFKIEKLLFVNAASNHNVSPLIPYLKEQIRMEPNLRILTDCISNMKPLSTFALNCISVIINNSVNNRFLGVEHALTVL